MDDVLTTTPDGIMTTGVTLVPRSHNTKLGAGVAATYVSPSTCPADCPLRGHGCYAEAFKVYVPGLRKLMTSKVDPMAAIMNEARLLVMRARHLRRASRQQDLRLHVVGDCPTIACASELGAACREWPGHAWSYTHAWRTVHRVAWGRHVSVLASVDHFDQAAQAIAMGYAPAVTVGQVGAARFDRNGVRWTPCPAQHRKETSCSTCRLCWHDAKLQEAKRGIVFETHGPRRVKARMALEQCRLFAEDDA